jgi:hypothetical protein
MGGTGFDFPRRLRARVAVAAAVTVAVSGISLAAMHSATASPAGFTTVDETVDGGGHCQNGNPNVNCNIYDAKEHVWMNGGPIGAALPAGAYFFAVLDPSGQASPNDGTTQNLSDGVNGDYTTRQFSVDSAGAITNLGTHQYDSAENKIRLAPYDDTTNPGGVYIMAICSLASGYPVTPKHCKYDAFKVRSAPTGGPDGDLSALKDVTPSFTRSFAWTIGKDVDTLRANIANGGTATFNYTVTVTRDTGTDGEFALAGSISVANDAGASGTAHNVTVSDTPTFDDSSSANCTIFDPSNHSVQYANDADIAPGSSLVFPYSCAVTGATAGTTGVNAATVDWSNDDPNLSTDSTVSPPAPFDFATATPSLVDDCVTVTDTLGGSLGSGPVCATTTFASYAHDFVGDPAGTCTTHDNTATFTSDTTQTQGSAKKTVTVCVGADLTVSKTANPAFTRSYLWSINKLVDKTLAEQIGGGTATFNYTVNVAQTGVTDSGWAASGTITVTNPNDWEAITANVTDAVDNGGTCGVTNGTNVSIPASGSVQRAYTCSYAAAPSLASGTNTATATWAAATYFTPDGSAAGQAPVAFTAPTTTVHKTVTVTDTFNSVTTSLGTVTATDATPYASQKFTYAHTVSVPTSNCKSYTNTAKLVETSQSSHQTVEVCGPAATGALTMGYWQNKNGQGIISGQAKTGVCPSGTWLRQFAPFQDLSATATCAQVAGYDLSIFTAANASGSAMNAMLKAQMLATAFDVYFSNPALGGNKIGASVPIGGVSIDLTKICKMIDSSGGSASCGGSYENTSAAFGNASSLTVLQLLTYAASQSNAGGSAWYGQVKATQGLAKDTFDAINNHVAFSP